MTQKMVDGVLLDLTAEEQAEYDAQQANPVTRRRQKIISRRQFFQALAIQGKITEKEAEDAVSIGAIPAAMQAVIDAISDSEQQFAARMLLRGAMQFENTHPLVATFAAAQSMSEADVDALWTVAAAM